MSAYRLSDALDLALTRRRMLRILGGSMSSVAIAGLLGACGGGGEAPPATEPSGGTSGGTTTTSETATSQPSGGAGGTPSASGTGGTLVVAANFVIQNGLDPARQLETTSNMICHAAYDSLVTFEGEDLSEPKPSLAESWEVSDDGITYTFTLRENVPFVNSGNIMTSEDVKWSLERVKNFKGNPSFLTDRIAEVQAPDPGTAVIVLDQAFSGILPILSSSSLGILDSKLVETKGGVSGPDAEERDTADEYLNQQSAGTGAYKITSYVPDQEVVLEAFTDHWRGAPSFERIVLRNITESAAQKAQLEAGDVDIATGISQDQRAALENSPGVVVKASPAATTFYLLMNNNPEVGGPFSDPKIQQAVRYALDYEGILSIAGSGAVQLAGVIPSIFPGAAPTDEAIQTDRERARALIAESGISDVSGALSFASDSVIWGVEASILAQKIQADLSEVGMTITLDGLPRAAALQKYRDGKNQLGSWSWAADWPDASNFMVFLPGNTVGMRAGWPTDTSPEAGDLADRGLEAQTEVDAQARIGLYQQVDRRIMEIGPYAPLFQPAALYAHRDNLEGVTYHSVWGVDFWTVRRT